MYDWTKGVGWVAVLIVSALFRFSAYAADDKPLVIIHGTLIDGLGSVPVQDATVVLQGRIIEYAGPAIGAVVPQDARVIDATGQSVMPGLADMHLHLQGAWNGVDHDLLGYQRYLNALLYSGVTTVLDTGDYQPWVLQLRQEQAAGHLLGPRIYCVGAMLDGTDPSWPNLAFALSSKYQAEEFVRRDKEQKVDLIKVYVNLSDQMLRWITDAAKNEGLRVIVDQHESRNGSPDLVRTRIAGFAHAPTRKMSDEDIQTIKDNGVFVLTTLAVTESDSRRRLEDQSFLKDPLIADTTPPWFLAEVKAFASKPRSAQEKRETQIALANFEQDKRNVKRLLDAGVLIAAGTDAPYPGLYQGEGIHRELELLVEAGFTPLQAIRAATYDAARVMLAEGEWGSLQRGRRANLLIIAGRPDKQIGDSRKIVSVIMDGRLLDRGSLRFDATRDPGFRSVPGLYYSDAP